MATLRQFEYLVTVVDTGSFTRAAELLHVTQPALSHQVRALERDAGGPLLERLPRAVRLTPMGRAMLPHARAALADAERARSAARQVSGLESGELQLATVYSASLGVLPPVLRAWRREHGGVRIRLFEHRHGDELKASMAAGQADVAVGPAPSDWDGPVHALGVEEFVVVLPPDDPVAVGGATRVELAMLADRGWVHYSPENGLSEVLDAACAGAGFQARAAVRSEQTAAAPMLAAAGLGPALVPANIIPKQFDGELLRPDPPVHRTLTAYTRSGPDPLTAAFVDTLARKASVLPDHVRRRLAPG
ncbi:DNA-binding transcriptional regulator, LysR family [Saccharopolyspora kobensis]|uniref:DNA-binding transcriptional regulator, LysR family n=1 Tax=Saccharopolyspora kobensis TaxID=146035 RepID=A0A1H6E6K5_9PSEU|nr:LysR family transcriptional regulator [Saccharopolyspora kobensis]SEG92596.1 DNA-binding transcriptional regulator, LysR family [Saccharopolyspora kobensis]SFD39198.1 DNA-binding transcriptional regulator, LysR family [Saccharopolyspora kobensis]